MKKYALIFLMAVLTLSGCTDTTVKKATTAAETETTSKFLEPSYSQTKKETKSYRGNTPVSDYVDDYDYLDDFDIYSVDYSTCFDKIGYNYDDETLYLRFLDSQKEYLYLDVPEYVFDELHDSDSPGVYYNDEIKGQYDCERLFE